MKPTQGALDALWHTLGLDPARGEMEPYRNHYVADSTPPPAIVELLELGLVAVGRRPTFFPAGDVVFCATERGRALAVAEASHHRPRFTRAQLRYRRWLADDTGEPFGDWLRRGGGPEGMLS